LRNTVNIYILLNVSEIWGTKAHPSPPPRILQGIAS